MGKKLLVIWILVDIIIHFALLFALSLAYAPSRYVAAVASFIELLDVRMSFFVVLAAQLLFDITLVFIA